MYILTMQKKTSVDSQLLIVVCLFPPSFFVSYYISECLTHTTHSAYVVTSLWFAYVEGYRGFQQKLSPLVVKRSFSLIVGQSHPLHFVLAPYYSLGLFHASKRRMITSWSVTVGIAGIIIAVKQLPYPWRNIIDAGVVAGLTWGSLSMLVFYIMSWVTGSPPDIDAAMPEPKIVVGKGAGAGDGGASK
jgi:hypothetical protein